MLLPFFTQTSSPANAVYRTMEFYLGRYGAA